MSNTWYELQAMCYECSGGIEYCRTLDDVADILAFDTWYPYGQIRVCTISNGLPKVIDKIGWNYSSVDDDDIDYYIANPEDGEEIIAYTFYDEDDGEDKVIFIFNKVKGA